MEIINFGKYKGESFDILKRPENYGWVKWFIGNDDICEKYPLIQDYISFWEISDPNENWVAPGHGKYTSRCAGIKGGNVWYCPVKRYTKTDKLFFDYTCDVCTNISRLGRKKELKKQHLKNNGIVEETERITGQEMILI